ncbi:MAG: thiamine pyrophosphate-dependent dehydrogenase E1 component subunit alpha [Chloroflexi bacterium]|nr:thiamine pyrophosphate-dependent dehydrogenase E1 component subunit alpha [Chloroflexota bacterium]
MLDNKELFRRLYQIRRFETVLLEQFKSGIFPGTTHTSLGQEANAVGVLAHLEPGDVVVSNHRCHGHFLAYGGDPQALFAELMGKPSGVCGGVGGSQHLHWRNFYSSGVQGGTVAMAAGMALAEKRTQSGAIVVDFMGDGTLGEGIVYECLNMISLWQLPVLLVLEHNQIAQTTPSSLAIAGSVPKRFEAFEIPTTALDSSDILDIYPLAETLIEQVRNESAPRALMITTARLGSHSKGDDTRAPGVLESLWQSRDPIAIQAKRLAGAEHNQVIQDIDAKIQQAFEAALAAEGGAG